MTQRENKIGKTKAEEMLILDILVEKDTRTQ